MNILPPGGEPDPQDQDVVDLFFPGAPDLMFLSKDGPLFIQGFVGDLPEQFPETD